MRPERTSFRSLSASPAPRLTVLAEALARPAPDAAFTGPASRATLRAAQSAAGRRLRLAAEAALPGEARGIVTSVSHSGRWVVAVAGAGVVRMGIDVEGPRRNAARLASHLGWSELAAPDRADSLAADFAQLWTLWEAAVKCDGTSVLADTTPAFVALRPGWCAGRGGRWAAEGYIAWSMSFQDGAWLSLVARVAAPSPGVFRGEIRFDCPEEPLS